MHPRAKAVPAVISPMFPIPVEVAGLIQELYEEAKRTQGKYAASAAILLEFVAWYANAIKTTNPDELMRILYCGLAPHMRMECGPMMHEIYRTHMISVRQEHFMTPQSWNVAYRKLHAKLDARGIYASSARRIQNDELCRTLTRHNAAKNKASVLFLAIWEMESLSLNSIGEPAAP